MSDKWDSDYGMRPQSVDTTYWGSDAKGHTIKFFGDTTGKYFQWDGDTCTIVGTLVLTGTFNTGNIALIDDETITFGTGLDINMKFNGTDFLLSKTVAAGNALKIDADTVDTTSDVFVLDVGVNSASVNAGKINLDVGTALSSGEIAKGIYLDINGKAANADTSGLYGIDVLITATSTDRADIIGNKITIDGTMDTADTIKGMLIDIDTTLSTSTLYGLHIDGTGITHTNATLVGIYNDLSAAVTAGSSIAEFIKLSAAATGISIDGGTNDSTAGNAITIDWDVNSSTSTMFNATVDVGTALSAGEIVKGIYLDINGLAANADTSGILGIDMTLTGVSTSASDLIGFKATIDGTKDQGDLTKGIYIDANNTINNANEALYGGHFDLSGVTHTNGKLYGVHVHLPAMTSGESYGTYIHCNATNEALHINSDTTDRTSGYCINADLGVNDGNCGIFYGTIDIGTAFSTAKSARGMLLDINESAAGFDGSGLYGIDLLMSGVATGRADLIGFKLTVDGTKSGGDLTKGLYVNFDQTLNNGSEYAYGTHIDASGVTHTNGILYGHYVDVSQVVTAGSNYGIYESLGLSGIGLYMTGTSGKATDSMQITSNAGKMNIDVEIDNTDRFEWFEDFIMQTINETDFGIVLHHNNHADPAISEAERGVLRCSTPGTLDGNGSQVCVFTPVQADSGGLVFETELKVDDISTVCIVAGLTDDKSAFELPASIGGGDAITTTATNGCFFVYDTGADTDQWFAIGVDTNIDATGSGTTGVAPVNATYQKLRIEIAADGETAKFYINDTLVKTLTAACTAASTNLYGTVCVVERAAAARNVDVDYIHVGHNR